MGARQDTSILGTSCQVNVANGAIGVEISFTTGMVVLAFDRPASIAQIAMILIDAETYTHTTNTTLVAVVRRPFR